MITDTRFRILQLVAVRRKVYAFEACKLLYPNKDPKKIYPFIHHELKELAQRGSLIRFEDNSRAVRRVMFCITTEGLEQVLEQERPRFSEANVHAATTFLEKYSNIFPRLAKTWNELVKDGLVSDLEAQRLVEGLLIKLPSYESRHYSPSKPHFEDMTAWAIALDSWASNFENDIVLNVLADVEKYAEFLRSRTDLQELFVKDAEASIQVNAGMLWLAEDTLKRINSTFGRTTELEPALSSEWNERFSNSPPKAVQLRSICS